MQHVSRSVTIRRPVEEVYGFWRNFEHLPRFMHHLQSVVNTGAGRSHWIASAPAGKTAEWDAEITEEGPGSRIGWRSLSGSDIQHAGVVRFRQAPAHRGTEVEVELSY